MRRRSLPLILLACAFLLSPLSALTVRAEGSAEEGLGEEHLEKLSDLDKQIVEIRAKLAELGAEARTLQGEIAYLDNQIYLTQLQINKTQTQIAAKEEELTGLQEDIGDLTERIATLGDLLAEQEEIFSARAREAYKSSRLTSFEILFGASSITRLIERVKYLQVLELADQRLITQMRTTREGCSAQKDLLEVKKTEVEKIKAEIETYKRSLESQRVGLARKRREKEALLAATQNSEQKYQKLLRDAQAQAAAIRSLVSTRGGATLLSGQTSCDDWGCYYNQRDSEWGAQSLGSSGLSVAEYGCLVSSVAMIATYHGFDLDPSEIAADSSAFFRDTAYLWKSVVVGGASIDRVSKSVSYLDSERANGPVIVGLFSGPAHFIVIKEKTDDGEYIMNDPWYEDAHDIPLSEYYTVGDITRVDKVIVR